MIRFTKKEKEFLSSLEEARIATEHDGIPHVKPVSYIFCDGVFLIATDYDTRTFKNVKRNPNVAIAIDVYKSGQHRAVCVQGTAETVEEGRDFTNIYKKFHEKFVWVRKEPWSENEAPFLRINPRRKTSWGLK